MVGGSLASSVHGFFRSTNDIDLVAAIQPEHVSLLATRLQSAFYIDADTIREALSQRRPFNLIHLASGYKFDFFPAAGNPYFETQIERSWPQEIALDEGTAIRCPLATPEDTILAKLAWYRAGGEQSERQWNDVRGILTIQGSNLDWSYMRTWASYLEVSDLLDRIYSEGEIA
jgi:hypothetical protein